MRNDSKHDRQSKDPRFCILITQDKTKKICETYKKLQMIQNMT